MKVRLTLQRTTGPAVDLAVTVDSTVTVSEMAAALDRCDPVRRHAAPAISAELALSLRVHPRSGRSVVLPPGSAVPTSGLRSGMTVSLAPVASTRQTDTNDGPSAVATVTVLAGPDAGRTFGLPEGTSYLGRGPDADIRLTDPMVSKRHARITVTDTVQITDTGSANGVIIANAVVQRATVTTQDQICLGDTTLSITLHRRASVAADSADVDFTRSPRLDPTFVGEKFVAPTPPELPVPQRMPVIAMVAPLIMGAVMYAFTRSVLSIVFIGLSPLLMIGSYFDTLITGRRLQKAQAKQFNESIDVLTGEFAESLAREQLGRAGEAPSSTECIDAMHRQTPLLWTRRTEHDRFATLRLGLGSQPSRHELEVPSQNKTKPEHWAKIGQLQKVISTVHDVPVVADLRECGALGVAGVGSETLGVARSLICQLVALHSPADLVVTAVIPAAATTEWDWLKWLPHVGSVYSPLTHIGLASSAGAATALAAELETLIASRQGGGPAGAADQKVALSTPAVVLLVQEGAPVDQARLVAIAENGTAASVFVVWVASAQDALPAVCRTFVTIDPRSAEITVGFVRNASQVTPVQCETVSREVAAVSARMLAPIADASAAVADDSDLPHSVSLLNLLGPELGSEPQAIIDRWHQSSSVYDRRPGASLRKRSVALRAVVGQAGNEPMAIDLRTQGPHALVGGTTGSGKSEFLQAWVLAMAAGYSPDVLTFLLVDYKGGSAFADCVHLPHSVGLVTDLSPHLVHRALTSLRAELRYREELLNKKKASDLLELQRKGDPEAPPSLVIIVDEFAALVQEIPEFVDGVVDVAQRGRSLGLHLILATQRPAGVIKDNLRANTNLRVALRMADADDSTDVLGSTDAAGFSPSIPGRAAVKTGPGRATGFQTGYAGGWTTAESTTPQLEIAELGFGAGVSWEEPESGPAEHIDRGPKDIARIVATVRQAAATVRIPAPRKPWLPELAPTYDLQFLGQRRDTEIYFGVIDDPDRQEQYPVAFEPDEHSNMAVLGTSGSGKSTVLRTLAIAAGITPRSGPCWVYCLDYGSAGLRMLESLPHVGAVISGDDTERVIRLVAWLREQVEDRADRYAKVRAGSITEYRALADRPDEPRILLLIDGIGAFREAMEFNTRTPTFASLIHLAATGRPLGIHIVVAGDRPSSIPATLSSSVQLRLVLRMADENDYLMLNVPKDALSADSSPGRGVLNGKDVQVAVFGGKSNVAAQGKVIEAMVTTMLSRGLLAAPPVKRLPEVVPAADLPLTLGHKVVIGLAEDSLQPVGIDPTGTFVVTGPPGSGRTTTLYAIVSAACAATAGLDCHYFGTSRSSLAGWAGWTTAAATIDEVVVLAEQLTDSLPSARRGIVVLEGIQDFLSTPAEAPLQDLLTAIKMTDHLVLADGEVSSMSASWGLISLVRASRRGFSLQPDQMDGDSVFRTSFPRVSRRDFPLGRGLLVEGGATRCVQIAFRE